MHKLLSALTTILSLVILFGISVANTAHAEVYKQVNPDGSVTFTDVPKNKDAEPVPIQPMSTFKATTAPSISSSSQKKKSSTTKYTDVSITSPANESTIRDNSGSLTVSASVTPSLKPGHKMVLLDNGSVKGESTAGSFNLSNVDRGEHNLSVQVQNKAGKTIISSKPVTVYLHRQSAR